MELLSPQAEGGWKPCRSPDRPRSICKCRRAGEHGLRTRTTRKGRDRCREGEARRAANSDQNLCPDDSLKQQKREFCLKRSGKVIKPWYSGTHGPDNALVIRLPCLMSANCM